MTQNVTFVGKKGQGHGVIVDIRSCDDRLFLLLDVFLQCHPAGQRSVYVPIGVGDDAFLRSCGVGIENERGDFSVPGAPDRNSFPESRVRRLIRRVVGDVENIVPVDE